MIHRTPNKCWNKKFCRIKFIFRFDRFVPVNQGRRDAFLKSSFSRKVTWVTIHYAISDIPHVQKYHQGMTHRLLKGYVQITSQKSSKQPKMRLLWPMVLKPLGTKNYHKDQTYGSKQQTINIPRKQMKRS